MGPKDVWNSTSENNADLIPRLQKVASIANVALARREYAKASQGLSVSSSIRVLIAFMLCDEICVRIRLSVCCSYQPDDTGRS
jgi:hypothetical protein